MPCRSGWGFRLKQGLVTLPRFPQPLVCSCGVTCDQRPLLRGKMVLNWYTCASFRRARWYRIDILAVNILWLYYVDISLSYFPIEFALWANYALSAIWLFVFCSQMVKNFFIHLAIQGVLGPQWAVGTIIWARRQSISLQAFWVSSEP